MSGDAIGLENRRFCPENLSSISSVRLIARIKVIEKLGIGEKRRHFILFPIKTEAKRFLGSMEKIITFLREPLFRT